MKSKAYILVGPLRPIADVGGIPFVKSSIFLCTTLLCSSAFATNVPEISRVEMVAHGAENTEYRLLLPNLDLAKNSDWIEEVHLTVSCGHIQAIAAIPDDWNVTVVSKMSEVEYMHAAAGHGASRLPTISPFNGTIRITGVTHDCFDISARILVSGEREREIDFSRAKLQLVK